MWFWVRAQANPGVSAARIEAKRKQWVSQGKDQQVRRRCRTLQRYLVVGESPTQVSWLIETDDPTVIQLMTGHFGDIWTIHTQIVMPQQIAEAMRGRAESAGA